MLHKHSVKVNAHTTSITLEDEFWRELKKTAVKKGMSLTALVSKIDAGRDPDDNLCSALRVFVLRELKSEI